MDYRDNRQRWTESHQVVHFYAGQWCTFTPALTPSYAFVAEPQTNGVAERFNRTLKEQIIHGRIYRNIAELRDAVRDFVELYNAQWIVEKNGYLSPAQARQAWHAAISIRPAA